MGDVDVVYDELVVVVVYECLFFVVGFGGVIDLGD